MKRLIGAVILLYASVGLGQTETSKNLLTATQTVGDVLFRAEANSYQYSFQTGQVTAVGVLPAYDPLQVLTLNWSFDALYGCNNSFGGNCGNPDGTQDEIQAFLAVGNEAGDSDVREVFNRQDFNQEWQTFSGAEVYDFANPYEAVSLRIDGVDRGFWAGYYGPRVRNPSVVAIYTPINTGITIVVDCSNPQNDPSCAGYGDNVAVEEEVIVIPEPQPPTFGEQATNTVFGDSADDFLFLEEPDATGRPRVMKHIEPQQVYQQTQQEEEMLGFPPPQGRPQMQGGPPPQDMPQMSGEPPAQTERQMRGESSVQGNPQISDEPLMLEDPEELLEIKKEPAQVFRVREATSEEVMAEVVRVTKEPRPEPARAQEAVEPRPVAVQRKVAPIDVASETRVEPAAEAVRAAVRPAVDVMGIALSLANQQPDQRARASQGQQQPQAMQQTFEVDGQSGNQMNGANYWGFKAKETQIAQTLSQQTQPQQLNVMTSVNFAPPSQEQFEDDFDDAIASGQSVGQFLSAQPPDFSRFEIDDPTIQEQTMVQKATVALKTMSEVQIDKSMDQQLETLSDTGGFTDQSVAVFLISSNPKFDQYQDVNLTDRGEFYKNTQVYPKNAPRVDPFGLLRLGGSETFNELVDIQWQR
jgi:hypothetical protein